MNYGNLLCDSREILRQLEKCMFYVSVRGGESKLSGELIKTATNGRV